MLLAADSATMIINTEFDKLNALDERPLTETYSVTEPKRVTRSKTGKITNSRKWWESLEDKVISSERTPSKRDRKQGTNPPYSLNVSEKTSSPKKRVSMKVLSKSEEISSRKLPSSLKNDNKLNRSLITSKSKQPQDNKASHKITDYFPIRRSGRKCQSELLKEKMEQIKATLLHDDDSKLDIQVVILEGKGRGVIASRNFVKGEFIVEYAGDLVDETTAKQLEEIYSMDCTKGCYMYYFKHKGKKFCVDATKESGRYGRLLNHSRVAPNCTTKIFMLGDIPRLILVAKCDISRGDELLFDYGDRRKDCLVEYPWLSS